MKSATRSASSPFLPTHTDAMSPVGGNTKRGLDILLALSALVALSPLFLMLTALVKFSDGGRIFYGHSRIGHGGRTFRCLTVTEY
jgi:exopolysaccharide production protein ExoY